MNKKLFASLVAAGAALVLVVVLLVAFLADGGTPAVTEPTGDSDDVTTRPSQSVEVEDWDEPEDDQPTASQPQVTQPSDTEATEPDDEDAADQTDPSIPSEDDVTRPTEGEVTTEPTKPVEPVKPDEPTAPSEPAVPSEPSKPSEPSEPDKPSEPSQPSEPTEPSAPPERDPASYTYEEYEAMTRSEQQAFMNRFESLSAFFDWYDAAKAEYDATRETIQIGGGGSVDLGDLIGGNG